MSRPSSSTSRPTRARPLLTLRNEGEETVRFQLQVNAWAEDSKEGMTLGSTGDIVFYPTLITLKPGETHKFASAPPCPSDCWSERTACSSRSSRRRKSRQQLRLRRAVLTRIGIPIFVEPTKVLESQALSAVALASGAAAFDLQNDGNVHLRVDTVRLEGFAPDGAPALRA